MEEKKLSTEEVLCFLTTLQEENEDMLTNIIESLQDVEQRIREVDYSLQEFEQKQDSNMNFFSPVGVYEEGEEKKNLLQSAEELKEKVPKLNERLEQYKQRREYIQYLKTTFQSMKQESASAEAPKETVSLGEEAGLRILESLEYDRNRIARDLHDSSVQSLTGLVHKTELCMRLVDMDTVRVKLELQTMIETIKVIINGMREIIYNLRPMSLDNLGLTVAIDAYCLQFKKNYDIDVTFQNLAEEPNLPSIYKVTLYRILQEACGNVAKHAKASKVGVTLSKEKDRLCLLIRDNGVGFDTEQKKEPKDNLSGFGLSIMKERIVLLGGSISIESVIGEGTTVSVAIPLQEKEEMSGNDSCIVG